MTTTTVTLGVDIGTSSTKGVLVDPTGTLVAATTRSHRPQRPRPGHVEMDAELWWGEFVDIAKELVSTNPDCAIAAVGVSGMGPCVLLTDEHDRPLRPAILYGVDTRATDQIAQLTKRYGQDVILQRCGSALTSQAVGPKLAWVAQEEPEVFTRARRLYMPSSWLVRHLTGEYVLDQHSASQCTPMYDAAAGTWLQPWADELAGGIELPALKWSDAVAGTITANAAAQTGLPEGVPVLTGTIDAWAEQVSVGAVRPGDLMLMYGTTMFLVLTVDQPLHDVSLWGTAGVFAGTHCLAGGMATSGAITGWLADLTGADHATLMAEASQSAPGSTGLLTLPYFAGERTPIMDPDARGVVAGLTLGHTRGDLYRSALEATAFGVRHNLEAFEAAGGRIDRIVAVGGGAQQDVWPQIVTDVTGREQVIPSVTIGAAYGDAYLAARALGSADIDQWNPPAGTCRPQSAPQTTYDRLYPLYRDLYLASRDVVHALTRFQHDASDASHQED
ncbi:xylulokinase [Branchiibius hedensis]|uniref:Xylulokinase n=1 Tax=Branchiibius hedensis TaxID=672460 RepID=A0A2Y9BTV4_9MICO|nr:FGGY-family carbohydrate kinase [Branchiibius hedensis]PWJ25859.1 xylulokinase [Branchiibius hedensis]SSA34672.1 xylulokinase [Branchiibius hedensis]